MKRLAVTRWCDFFLADHVMDAMLLLMLISGSVMNVCPPSNLSHFSLKWRNPRENILFRWTKWHLLPLLPVAKI